MAKPEYAIREVSLAEVILFLLSAIILAAYHFDYRVATYIIFLDFFQSFKIIVALRQLMETKRHQKMFGSLPDAYYYDSLLMRKYNWIWTNTVSYTHLFERQRSRVKLQIRMFFRYNLFHCFQKINIRQWNVLIRYDTGNAAIQRNDIAQFRVQLGYP